MEGSHRSHATFYRCRAQSLAPRCRIIPPNVYLREDYLTAKINSWVAEGLFDLARAQRKVEALAERRRA